MHEQSENALRGTIVNKMNMPLKGIAVLTIRVGESEVVTQVPIGEHAQLNDEVWLGFKKYHVFDGKTGMRTQTITAG